jgi:hypothetical protein
VAIKDAECFEQPSYRTTEEYRELIRTLHAFTAIVLFGLLDDSAELRDQIIRTFIARGMTLVESIEALWNMQHFQDCYALYRCLLDRLFHLHVLDRDDSFEHFDNWCFLKQFDSANYARSHQGFKGRSDIHVFSAAEKARRKALIRKGVPAWCRPDPCETSKDMGLVELYHLGYAHASQHVHPMANDGQEDFERMTMLRTEPRFDQRSVLSNSILIQLLLTRNGLTSSTFEWRRLIGTFLDECLAFLREGTKDYEVTFVKIASQGPDLNWARKR